MKQELKIIPLDRIFDPEKPLRSDLSPESVSDLAESIAAVGIIEPLIVCPKGEGFEVVAGHRRLAAAELAGLAVAPCIVVKVEGMQKEVLKLHENLIRAQVSPTDWANHLAYLKKQYGLSSAKIAEFLGMSVEWVQDHLAILNYPPELLEALQEGKIAYAAARELSAIKDPKTRAIYVRHAILSGVTSTLAAKWAREANRPPLQSNEAPQEGEPQPQPPPLPEGPPICPVCQKEIGLGEEVTLIIHASCQPT